MSLLSGLRAPYQNWLRSAAATEWPQSAGEISKLHDTTHRGTLGELAEEFQMNIPKGEIVIVIDGKRTNRRSVPPQPNIKTTNPDFTFHSKYNPKKNEKTSPYVVYLEPP